MEGPHPLNHKRAVAAMFGPEARLAGTLGTPERPGVVEIHVGPRLLASGPDFARAIEAATIKAADLASVR